MVLLFLVRSPDCNSRANVELHRPRLIPELDSPVGINAHLGLLPSLRTRSSSLYAGTTFEFEANLHLNILKKIPCRLSYMHLNPIISILELLSL